MSHSAQVLLSLPTWVAELVSFDRQLRTLEARMELAIRLSRENVVQGTGGPFGAAVFERESGMLVSAGVNLVEEQHNSALHGEMVALMLAEARLGSYTLGAHGMPEHELVTSCEPCAMCFGALMWSGVTHVVSGAGREDAEALGFDEGPVFPESYAYLEARGITFTHDVLRDEAVEVLRLYRETGGVLYNP